MTDSTPQLQASSLIDADFEELEIMAALGIIQPLKLEGLPSGVAAFRFATPEELKND